MADDDFLAELCGVSSAAAMDALADDHHREDHDELAPASDAAALLAVEHAVIETQAASVTAAGQSLGAAYASAVSMAKLICEGRYADVLRTSVASKIMDTLAAREVTDEHLCAELITSLETLVLAAAEPAQQLAAAYEVLFTGVALFNMYVQANYTGPAFEPAQLKDVLDMCARVLKSEDSGKKAHSDALVALQVDGESPYSICEYPQFLALGRSLLHFVGNYAYSNWSVAVAEVDNEDSVTADVLPLTTTNDEVKRVLGELNSAVWWNTRAAVAHARLLIAKTPSNTLWYETRRGYLTLLRSQQNKLFKDDEYLLARAYVEWGLAQHHFDKNKHGKRTFEQAKVVSGISVQLSGSMGKRTKFQQKSVAQMVLLAASKRTPQQNAEASVHAEAIAASTHADFGGKKVDDAEVNEDGLTKEEQAIQKLVQDGEATYRNVQLDQVDQDNVLLENIAFEDKALTHQGNLQIVDQLVLLALCLDVKNSNANDGLTREEMMPYITRVLENPNNWMVYSTGLLERAWLECETSKRRERAVLQMQALVDQHTTRLTVMQNTLQAIEDAAPAHERLQFVHALAFPPRYALKRDLADRYLALGVVGSAVEMFEELEIWDEVVKCYQILDKPTRAEKVVRERLDVAPTPYMWCCLGDLTRDISHYETSWELSKKRFARAKRSLGRYFFEKGDYEAAIPHYQDSVEVNPMNTGAWFTLGAMAMRSEKWSLGLRAFTRVVQLEPDNGEAWGNIGSIHMRNDQYAEAFSVLHEALKQKRHMWQMWENYALCAMETERYGEAIYAMHQLLDLRSKHKRPVDHQILAWLVEAIVYPESLQKMLDDSEDKGDDSVTDAVAIGAESDDEDDLSQLDEATVATDATPPRSGAQYKKQLALLFGRITSIVTNNAKIWHLYAHFNDGLGRKEKARDCRLKQCRALQTAGWETDGVAVDELCKAAARLARDYMDEGTKKALYSCRLYIRGVLKKAQVDYADTEAVQLLGAALDEVNAMEAQL